MDTEESLPLYDRHGFFIQDQHGKDVWNERVVNARVHIQFDSTGMPIWFRFLKPTEID